VHFVGAALRLRLQPGVYRRRYISCRRQVYYAWNHASSRQFIAPSYVCLPTTMHFFCITTLCFNYLSKAWGKWEVKKEGE